MAGEGSASLPTEQSRIFPETRRESFKRQFSEAADERVQNKLGSKMKFSEGVIFMMNSLTGLSVLTFPYGFAQAGILLGALIILASMIISFMTATFMCDLLLVSRK